MPSLRAANLIRGEGSAERRPQRKPQGHAEATRAFSAMNDFSRDYIGGGLGIRTHEGIHQTRFPSLQHLGAVEFSDLISDRPSGQTAGPTVRLATGTYQSSTPEISS